MFQKRLLSLLLLVGLYQTSTAQNIDLFSEKSSLSGRDITTGIFKSTRVVNGQSIENVGAGVLDFRILHRQNSVRSSGKRIDQYSVRDQASNEPKRIGRGICDRG